MKAAQPKTGGTPTLHVAQSQHQVTHAAQSRRQALLLGVTGTLLWGRAGLAGAVGLESVPLPPLETPQMIKDMQKRNQAKLDIVEEAFQSSDFLKTLKERSAANKDERRKELLNRYCYRQAEMGVGDCSGLRLIPGATKSGIQKKPQWMEKMLGNDGEGGVEP